MSTVGAGKYTYSLVSDWATFPGEEGFGSPASVATDSEDRVYVFQRGKEPPVLVFDRDGSYLKGWGAGAMAGPHHICITDDVAYLVDREDSVVLRYTLDGKPLQVIGNRGCPSDTGIGPDFDNENDVPPKAAGPFNYPTKMVPSPTGDIYVSDGYQNSRVHRFSADGRLITSWGEPGKDQPGKFHLPHSVLVTQDRRVYVCDRENHRIQVFDAYGGYITSWTNVRRPMDIAVDKDGVFYILEVYVEQDRLGRLDELPEGVHRVSVLDGEGTLLSRWDTSLAHGLCVDAHGDIYLAVLSGTTVHKYVRKR